MKKSMSTHTHTPFFSFWSRKCYKRRKVRGHLLRGLGFFFRNARDTFKHLCLLDANSMQLFPLPALFKKDFLLGPSEVFPEAILQFQSFTYSRQQQMCREMALCCHPGLQG